MDDFFRLMGRKAGQAFKKSKWVYHSVFGDEEDALRSEYHMGSQMADDIKSIYTLRESAMIDRISNKLVACINDPHRFHFTVFHSAEVNAFALPGGFIFISDSLIEFCDQNEDEIAFVLAHEIAHVVKGHAFNRMLAEYSLGTISRFVKVGGYLGSMIRQVTDKFLKTHHSRENEFEADNYGIRLIRVSPYNTCGAVDLFGRLNRIHKSDMLLPEYFSTHPPYKARIDKIAPYLGGQKALS